MSLDYNIKSFNDLTNIELYSILQLRNEVFAVEQNCVYYDMDNKDQPSFHLMGWQENKLLAYTRLLPPGIVYDDASIGRVVTSRMIRGSGEGKELMLRSIAFIHKRYGPVPIRISAQLYLLKFYADLGFLPTTAPYIEDHIEHIEMLLA